MSTKCTAERTVPGGASQDISPVASLKKYSAFCEESKSLVQPGGNSVTVRACALPAFCLPFLIGLFTDTMAMAGLGSRTTGLLPGGRSHDVCPVFACS